MRLAARGGARYAANAPRLFAAAGEQRQQLRDDLALRTAQDVADTLGTMKGVLMKIGQLASYVDDGLAPPARRVLSRLQDSVPPMSAELAAGVVTEELGAPPERIFKEWDPLPIAAASIGQVHRAITTDGQAVAVKVQYPGIAETIAADLGNVSLIRSLLKMAVPSQDVTALVEELRERISEELDYVREAENQRQFAAYFDGHPTARVPKIIDELSTARVITSELDLQRQTIHATEAPSTSRRLGEEAAGESVKGGPPHLSHWQREGSDDTRNVWIAGCGSGDGSFDSAGGKRSCAELVDSDAEALRRSENQAGVYRAGQGAGVAREHSGSGARSERDRAARRAKDPASTAAESPADAGNQQAQSATGERQRTTRAAGSGDHAGVALIPRQFSEQDSHRHAHIRRLADVHAYRLRSAGDGKPQYAGSRQ